ncbi:MAG: PP0621 family protein [Proteobacteria bacterium]|nr:PP0621 family protein [Pseudomonadota bacterium]
MLVRVIIAVLLFVCLVAIMRQVRAMTKSVDGPRVIEAKTARCAHCEVYFPHGESITRDGRTYCSPAHAAQDQLR